jgi:hypothetical protein
MRDAMRISALAPDSDSGAALRCTFASSDVASGVYGEGFKTIVQPATIACTHGDVTVKAGTATMLRHAVGDAAAVGMSRLWIDPTLR